MCLGGGFLGLWDSKGKIHTVDSNSWMNLFYTLMPADCTVNLSTDTLVCSETIGDQCTPAMQSLEAETENNGII